MKINKYLIFSIFITFLLFSQAAQGARLSGDDKIKSTPGDKLSPPDTVSKGDSEGMNRRQSDNKNVKIDSIDFDGVDITVFIKFISELTGKNFLIDNNVKGKVTIISPTEITVDEAYRVFESVLEVNGFATVEAGSVIKIVPALDARSKDIETRFRTDSAIPEDRIVTQLIPLKHASPGELQRVLSSFISKTSVMASYEPTNMLIVTDFLSNITRILEIVNAIDVPGTGEEITVLPLKHANALKIANSLNAVFRTVVQADKNKTATSTQVILVPDERTNTLIIVASEVDTLKVRELVDLLDKVIPKGDSDIHVYYLQNASAEELSSVLTSIPTKDAPKDQKGTAPVLSSKDIQIVADKSTNSLIITARKDDYAILEDVIRKLDIPRRMVYIEALVMEVSMSNELELGVQMLGGDEDPDLSVFGGSNTGVNNFPKADNGNVILPSGLTLGVLGNTIKIGDLTFPDIGAVVRAYATDSDLQILSTPQIMTIDNEEAEIKVVDKVPFISRMDTTTGSNVAYSNYDFEEVGVILNITPQINQERFVRLKISQEVSQIVSKDVNNQPTTLKRQANTTVFIRDGQTIVIGGLIDEKDNSTNYRVPLLSRIPILGYLFRSKTKSLDKKNLYIFITPHIIENPEEADVMYEDKKGHIDAIKEGVIRMNSGGHESKDMRLVNLGYNYLRLKEYGKALDYYNRALENNPENPYALLNTGYIHQILGDSQKARDMYEKLIALDPDDRVVESTDPAQAGKKLTDIAKNNLKTLETD